MNVEEEKKSEIDDIDIASGSSEVMTMKVDGDETSEGEGGEFFHKCCTRLFHVETDAAITEDNRLTFIADDETHEEITKSCQEVAQEHMSNEGCLEWITMCYDESKGQPTRAFVARKDAPYLEHVNDKSIGTMLISTGNGKVRAGMFSRQHSLIINIVYNERHVYCVI